MGLDIVLPLALGVSLAAATGFRVFLPILVMGLAAKTGYMPISSGFEWVATTPALLMLTVAAITEIFDGTTLFSPSPSIAFDGDLSSERLTPARDS